MSTRLTRAQATLLGILVLATLVVGGLGLVALAAKDRLWTSTYDITLAVADAGDLPVGTPVRVRGVEAGHITAIDDSTEPVTLTLALDAKYRGRIFHDATAKVQAIGLLGSKAVAITPGTAASGVDEHPVLMLTPTPSLDSVVAEAAALLSEARTGNGTLAKLVKDDALYTKATAAVGHVESEAKNVSALVADGRDTLRSVKQNTDAVSRMPIVRNYVENADVLLLRPECRKSRYDYAPADLFEPGTAILHDRGREHINALAAMLKADPAKLELVVASMADGQELSRKQAEVVAEALKAAGAHKTGFWHKNRPVSTIGLGNGPSPLETKDATITVLAFQV